MNKKPIYQNYIDGKWCPPSTGRYYPSYNPAREDEIIGEFPLSSTQDVNRAVESAHKAFKTWGSLLPIERNRYIKKFIAILDEKEKKEKIGEAICAEQGKTLKEALAEPSRGVVECTYIMGEGERMEGITMPSDRPGVTSVANRTPLGVVAAIAPWNFPFLTPIRKIMPALAAGNTVVFKPASDTPYCAILLAELFEEAGFPPGVVNTVIGRGGEIGDTLCAHPLVRGITFTGSTEVGHRINEKAATHFAKVQLEMGGKNPAIVTEFRDLDYAASQLSSAAFALAGQRCTSISRVIVTKDIAETLEQKIIEKMTKNILGDGMDPKVTIGPMTTRKAGEKVLKYLEEARAAGAVVTGGEHLTGGIFDRGMYITPALVTHATADMSVSREEIFGPVLTVIRVDSFEEAMAIANDTHYGLAAALFSDNLGYIHTFLRDIESGMAHVNHGTVTDGTMPFGGIKSSGLGNFSKGSTNKDFFTQLKVTYIKWK